MTRPQKLPGIFFRFFKWYCREERYEELHGDLEELFHDREHKKGLNHARLHYCWDVIKCCQPYSWRKPSIQLLFNTAMFKNLYITSLRNLLKSKSHSLINLSGLTCGMACFIFIALYILNETSYDRFHSKYENIYRISNHANINGKTSYIAVTNSPITKTLLNDQSEVVAATRIVKSAQLLVGIGEQKFYEENVLFVDSSFFEIFDFQLIRGNPSTALVEPKSLVLSESYARKYFGHQDPIGKQITVDSDTVLYQITGVVAEAPANSHIQFDMLGSMSSNKAWNTDIWIGGGVHAYVLLQQGTHIASLEDQMQEIFYQHVAPEIEYHTSMSIDQWEAAGNSSKFKLVPLKDIHLKSVYTGEMEPTGNISYIYIYAAIGLIILFIAIFNYVNLATAQASTRSKEVGIRKFIGSKKSGIAMQFIVESVSLSIVAAGIAAVLVFLLKPSFQELIDKELAFDLTSDYISPVLLVGLAVIVGLVAGFYPSLILSGYQPVQALKGRLFPRNRPGWIGNSLVVLQFTATIIIIIATVAVYSQINYMMTKNLGFQKDKVLILSQANVVSNLESFKDQLMSNANISGAAESKTTPGKSYSIRSYRPKDNPQTFLFMSNLVSYDYLPVMGMELVSGRFFSRDFPADSKALVINESAARSLGFEDPIGQQLSTPWHKGAYMTIIGVVKDYHVESLHKNVEPVALELIPENTDSYLSIKLLSSENVIGTVGFIEDLWNKHTTNRPIQYTFLDQDYGKLYTSETNTGKVFVIFTILSIFIACLGLIGLISYTLSVREKEIGIRKVLGASFNTLIWLLSNHLIRLFAVATLIAWPLAYFGTKFWLQNFVDRISIHPVIYLGAALLVILFGSLSIGFQTIRATRKNPVTSLRQQ